MLDPSAPVLWPATSKHLFSSPAPAGRKITAGFSFLQRIGKSASIDVWFPDLLRQELDALVARGAALGPPHFPAEWAAIRQFELLHEAGNYKIFDLDVTHITRALTDVTRSMRAGGYRVTIASIGSYAGDAGRDDLEILDRHLQDRISHLIHMLYLEEQSAAINDAVDKTLAAGLWDYQTALPHIGVTLGSRDLFRPAGGPGKVRETAVIPGAPHKIRVARAEDWAGDLGVRAAGNGDAFKRVEANPESGQYACAAGVYQFAAADAGRRVTISCRANRTGAAAAGAIGAAERKHKLARHFFDILGLLPQNHIVHDTAVGLQLPELIGEHEWIYLAAEDETLRAFNSLLTDVFAPFDGLSLAALDGRADAGHEVKSTVQHLRGYGDRLTPEADRFYQGLAQMALQ